MKRKTIGRNPLDTLAAVPARGKKSRGRVAADPEVKAEIREAILKRAPAPEKKGALAQFLQSALDYLSG